MICLLYLADEAINTCVGEYITTLLFLIIRGENKNVEF